MPLSQSTNEKSTSLYRLDNANDVPLSNSVSIRVYSDTQPHNLKIRDLQKGLILVHDSTETVGEGTGFGLPILIYPKETCFSGTSRVHIVRRNDSSVIQKEFIIDRMSRNRFRNVILENSTARDILAFLAHLYRLYPRSRFLALKGLTRKMDIDSVFVKKQPMGKVIVSYIVSNRDISVKADFTHLADEGFERAFMLNEQGSEFYRRYFDSEGIELRDTSIGAWNRIDADWAALTTAKNEVGFRLWRRERSVLRRGREFLKDILDWVGLDYEIPAGTDVFEYPIEILGK